MFIFGNKTSDEMGLDVVQYTLRKKAGQNYQKISVPGRPSPFIDTDKTFDPVQINIECVLTENADVNSVFEWISGKGILIDERYPDKYRVGAVYDEIDTVAVNDEILSITIPFVCDPFMYAVENTPIEATSSPAYIPVSGTYYSEPIYELHFASGTEPQELTFSVNGQAVTINLTAEHLQHPITLNAMSQKIYYSDTKYLILPDTTGLIPYLNYGGNNLVEWSPAIVEKVIITKNERWL